MNNSMKRRNLFCTLVITGLFITSGQLMAQEKQELFFADPTIYVENGKYYLTGTGGSGKSASEGFAALESTDLKNWTVPTGMQGPSHMILSKGKQAFGTHGFWAPQLYKEKGTYYLTYTANEQTVLTQSEALLGPYTQMEVAP